jgi:hypothetical protein
MFAAFEHLATAFSTIAEWICFILANRANMLQMGGNRSVHEGFLQKEQQTR